MAGKPGMKGGGGKRPGAGRKAKPKPPPPPPVPQGDRDMLQMLQDVALGLTQATPLQVRAAIAAVQYTHTKRGDGGKKDEANERAGKVASGSRFGPAKAPLRVVGGK